MNADWDLIAALRRAIGILSPDEVVSRSEAARILSGCDEKRADWIKRRDAMTDRLRAEIADRAARQGRGGWAE